MNVHFVTRRAAPARGGMESFLHHLTQGLQDLAAVRILARRIDEGDWSRYDEAGLRPQPAFSAWTAGRIEVEQLEFTTAQRLALAPLYLQFVPGMRRYSFGRSRRIAAAHFAAVAGREIAERARTADILHAWGPDMLAKATVIAGRRLNVPVVISPFTHLGQWGDDPCSIDAIRTADAIAALLEADASTYRKLGAERARVSVCGVSAPAVPRRDPGKAKARLGIADDLVLFLGARRAYKGLDIFLDIARRTLHRGSVVFGVAGPGAAVAPAPNVRDFGAVDEGVKADLFAAAEIVCLPSSHEILPVTVLEAWSTGTPVVVSDIPPLRELARCGGAISVPALAEPFTASVEALLLNPVRRRQMGEAGARAWERQYTVKEVAAKHLRLYETVLAERPT